MKVLVACEESQRVCMAFRNKGHEAYSCDLVKCSGGHPEWHILMDARAVLNGGVLRLQNYMYVEVDKWDLIIAHPPCTYLTNAATRHHSLKTSYINWINARMHNRIIAMDFFMACVEANCDRIAVENPIGVMNTCYRKPDQIIHPYYFASSVDDTENYQLKKTCLWLKNLPTLERTSDLPKPSPVYITSGGKVIYFSENHGVINERKTDDATARSKTFPAIAKAMADQWG